jgi:uncharacterized protein
VHLPLIVGTTVAAAAALKDPTLTVPRALIIMLAGGGAGFMNSIVGSGTLISFPTLVGVGFDQITANATNNIGIFPGSASASYGYRKELIGQRKRLLTLGPASMMGAVIGALLVFKLPPKAFKVIVPFLILFGVILVLLQPTIMKRVKARRAGSVQHHAPERISPLLWIAVMLTGIYGGYFGAAQGVILIGIMGSMIEDDLVRINATKNVLSTIVGAVAGLVFIFKTHVSWPAIAIVATGSIAGGLIGSRIGRKIPPNVLRGIVATIGLIAAIKLLAGL